jgi:hypothetical protein
MANFLVVLPRLQPGPTDPGLLQKGIDRAGMLKRQTPTSRHETTWGAAALFARRNGSGAPIAHDPATGSWLLAAGTWFHEQGFGSGDEGKLLTRYLEVDALALARELDGFFCLVIGDGRTREIVVITDVAGSYHAYLRELPHGVVLSGSSLLLAALAPSGLDALGCQEFLHTGVIYEDRTCFRDVRKLAPATVYRFAEGRLAVKSIYWDVSDIKPESLNGECAVRALWGALCDGARRIGRVYPRIACDLTGGYDSRAMAAGLRGAGVPFTATVSGPAASADVRVSGGLAARIAVPHLHTRSSSEPLSRGELHDALMLTDGEYDIVDYARILRTHRGLMTQFDLSINGSYGELARGYWWELLFPKTGARVPLDAVRLAARRFAALPYDFSLSPAEGRVDLIAHFAGIVERTNARLRDAPNTLQMDHAYLRMRMQRWQGRIASSTNQLWPCLSPFMFRRALETMLQTRASLRRRSLLIRRMLAEFQPVMARYPLEHGYPAFPATWRTLPRFWPLAGYYGGRIWRRVTRESERAQQSGVPPRLQLWEDPQLRERLDPARMTLTRLIDERSLANFLARSRELAFPYDDQWRRVLTLEWALQMIA